MVDLFGELGGKEAHRGWLSTAMGFGRRGTTMVIRCGGQGGWLRAWEASGGRRGPQEGGGWVGEGLEAVVHGGRGGRWGVGVRRTDATGVRWRVVARHGTVLPDVR
jgi:hypothetical protein